MLAQWKELLVWVVVEDRSYMLELELLLHFHEGMEIFKGRSIDTNPLSRADWFGRL